MLTDFLIKCFVPDSGHPERPEVRLKYGILSGWTGFLLNLFLSSLKFAVGLLSGSIAVAADAVNNLSDAGSSIVMFFGFKASSAPADRGHPFGHGRVEYVAGVIVSVIIISAGLNFLKESAIRIFRPEAVHVSDLFLCLIGGSMAFKFWLCFFHRKISRLIRSEMLKAASFDSLSDVAATGVVLFASAAGRFTDFPVDGCAGVAAALFAVVGGLKLLRDTINPLLGEPPRPELVNELKSRLLHCGGILGVHDIIVHNYGPNRYFATAHAEVSPGQDILEVHDMLENAERTISESMPVHLLLHCDPCRFSDRKTNEWNMRIENAAALCDRRIKVYGTRLKNGRGGTILSFDILVPREINLLNSDIEQKLSESLKRYPDCPRLEMTFLQSYLSEPPEK